MKQIIILSFLLTTLSSQGQDSALAKSKFEIFSEKAGKLFLTEETIAGSIKKVKLVARRVTDLESKESHKAVIIGEKIGGIWGNNVIAQVIVDYEELDAVIKTLAFYNEVVKEKKPKNSPYYNYTTNNDVIITCEWVPGTYYDEWQINIAKRYHYLRLIIPSTTISLRNKDVDDIIEMLKKAKDVSFGN